MSTEDNHSRDAAWASRARARSEVPKQQPFATDAHEPVPRLVEVEELIRGVLAVPAQNVDPDIVALLRSARKTHKNFQISLALRALRLEQGLRAAQQQLIRLQWELARLRPREASSFSPEAEDY